MSDHDYDDDWDGNLLADGQRAYDAMKQRAEKAEALLREMTSYANILSQTVDLVGKGVSVGVYPSAELVKTKIAEARAFLGDQ